MLSELSSQVFVEELLPVKSPQKSLAESINTLEEALLGMPQADIQTIHTFLPGVYERTILIPPWTVLTGALHKQAYRVRLEEGVIAVNTDNGVRVLEGPQEFDVPVGMRRVGRVFEQAVRWTDIYPNEDNCTDIKTLEDRLYEIPVCGLGENRVAALQKPAEMVKVINKEFV